MKKTSKSPKRPKTEDEMWVKYRELLKDDRSWISYWRNLGWRVIAAQQQAAIWIGDELAKFRKS